MDFPTQQSHRVPTLSGKLGSSQPRGKQPQRQLLRRKPNFHLVQVQIPAWYLCSQRPVPVPGSAAIRSTPRSGQRPAHLMARGRWGVCVKLVQLPFPKKDSSFVAAPWVTPSCAHSRLPFRAAARSLVAPQTHPGS